MTLDKLIELVKEKYQSLDSTMVRPEHEFRSVAEAICSLKVFTNWLEQDRLVPQRLSYFFDPQFSCQKNSIVFLTTLLYCRDIFENLEINNVLHEPIVLVSPALAHYLFREYPIHIHFRPQRLHTLNNRVSWIEMGGLQIASDSLSLDAQTVDCIKVWEQDLIDPVDKIVYETMGHTEFEIKKTAISEYAPGMFKLDVPEQLVSANDVIWDKNKREVCKVVTVDPGEGGDITIDYPDGHSAVVPKSTFDLNYCGAEK